MPRLPPCSAASSIGASACAHWLSLRPSQNSHGLYAVPTTVIVLRGVSPMPCARGSPSVKWSSAWWQVAHETSPFALNRVSEKIASPRAAAAGSSATRFEGSSGRSGRLPIHSERSASTSSGAKSGIAGREGGTGSARPPQPASRPMAASAPAEVEHARHAAPMRPGDRS